MFKNRSVQVKLVKDQKPANDPKVVVDELVANTLQANAYAAVARKFVDETIDNAMIAGVALLVTKAACDIIVLTVKRTLR